MNFNEKFPESRLRIFLQQREQLDKRLILGSEVKNNVSLRL